MELVANLFDDIFRQVCNRDREILVRADNWACDEWEKNKRTGEFPRTHSYIPLARLVAEAHENFEAGMATVTPLRVGKGLHGKMAIMFVV
jgi:hypothetical protein